MVHYKKTHTNNNVKEKKSRIREPKNHLVRNTGPTRVRGNTLDLLLCNCPENRKNVMTSSITT